MTSRSTGLTTGFFFLALLIVPSLGCESQEDFSEAASAQAPDEPMVNPQNSQRKRRKKRRSGQTEMPSDHPPVGGAQGDQERGSAGVPSQPSQGQGPGGAGGADLPVEWSTPEGWTETEPSSSMRKTQFRLPAAEGAEPATLAVFYFGGQAGGGPIRANIDRWVGQFEGPDGGSVEDEAEISKKKVNGLEVHVVDVAGTYDPGTGMGGGGPKANSRMLGAIIDTGDGLVVFKLVGPKKTVTEQREEFSRFVESFRLAK